MTPDSPYFELKKRNQRRFLFVVTALFLAFFGMLLIYHGVIHPENTVVINRENVFIGYANPYFLIVGYGSLSGILVHFLWVLRREHRLSVQRFAIGVHFALAVTGMNILLTFMNSTWMDERFRNTYGHHPYAALPPSLWMLLLPAFVILTFIPHALSWGYHEWLTRRLTRREVGEKRKRDPGMQAFTLMVGDDGELLYPIEMSPIEKRLR